MNTKQAIQETLEIAHQYLAHSDRNIRLMAHITIQYCKEKDKKDETPNSN